MLKQKYFLTGIFILSAERQPIKLAWRKIVWLQEMGLHYNRFRYYSQDMGMYISSDSIGLEANNPTLCGYVQDVTLNEQK